MKDPFECACGVPFQYDYERDQGQCSDCLSNDDDRTVDYEDDHSVDRYDSHGWVDPYLYDPY